MIITLAANILDVYQVRKKQNRDAQLAYRGRKRAAEEAQKGRVQRLEAVVEQMSSVFTEFADEMMTFEELKQHRGLVSSLSKTMRRMVTLAGEVVEDTDAAEAPPDAPLNDVRQLKRTRAEDVSSDDTDESRRALTSVKQRRIWSPRPQKIEFSTPLPWAPQVFGNGWLTSHSPVVNMAPPRDGRFVLPETFAYRLVEQTLLKVYDCLLDAKNGDRFRQNFVFWWAAKEKSREDTLVHLRWMLGRGRHNLYRAIDIPAEHYAKMLSIESNRKLIKCEGDFDDGFPGVEISESPPVRGFLNALEIQQKLEKLVGEPLEGDLIDFTFPGGCSAARSSLEHDNRLPYSQDQCGEMTFQLNLPLLINNMVTLAVCLIVGPGYYHDGLSKAVEAALVPMS